jgi:hypothetical protein
MIRKAAIHLFGLFVTVSLLTGSIFACACCAEPGTRVDYTGKTDQFIRDLIQEIKFADEADLYMTEAGFDGIKGLDPLRKEDEATFGVVEYASAAIFTGKAWQVTFKTPKGASAIYSLPVPLNYAEFKVDIHDEEERPNGPLLYKELRFKGLLTSATGFAKAGVVRNTKFELVFSGRGNGCNNPEDYTHWSLGVIGPKAEYAFFGKLSTGRKNETADTTAMLDTRH